MKMIKPKDRQEIAEDVKLSSLYEQFKKLLQELEKKDLPPATIEMINQEVAQLNLSPAVGKEFRKVLKQKQAKILKLVEKELKIVPKNYYRNLWLALGMSAFGLPLGVALGLSIGNMSFLAIGLPVGMVIGMAIGSAMDKKAWKEGRQLNIEMKY